MAEKPLALLAPVESRWLDQAFDEFLEGKRAIYFSSDVNFSEEQISLPIRSVLFKRTHTTSVSARANVIEITRKIPPNEVCLENSSREEHRFYYGFTNLIKLAGPVPLSSLKRYPGGGFVRNDVPGPCIIEDIDEPSHSDALIDIDQNAPNDRAKYSVYRYARDPAIRDEVKLRAKGCCEYCNESGFLDSNGRAYLECHHIIALADQGADKMSNVIALCPNHHREAHFGQRAEALEDEMTVIVKRKEGIA